MDYGRFGDVVAAVAGGSHYAAAALADKLVAAVGAEHAGGVFAGVVAAEHAGGVAAAH